MQEKRVDSGSAAGFGRARTRERESPIGGGESVKSMTKEGSWENRRGGVGQGRAGQGRAEQGRRGKGTGERGKGREKARGRAIA